MDFYMFKKKEKWGKKKKLNHCRIPIHTACKRKAVWSVSIYHYTLNEIKKMFA